MASDGGLSKFQKRMRAIPVAARAAIEPALMKSAGEIADLQRSMAPEKSGKLKASIAVTGPGEATPPYSQPGGSMTMPFNSASITVGNTDVRYPHLVEYGHKNGFNGSEVPAHPFFWPGFRLGRKRALSRIKRAIGKAIREAK
ncbi:HK97 gp10 family phage protein [Paracoccus sp. SM22M-07]|uniref:HK97 gp10 family phage protein n=1 Tax=Paracoccus sp. SM22M-07 TaxID=1520813 RepID=UPI0009199BE1|nr:HK97 gp10 family phage protein [Paracoccus sp. SM22M-07]OJH45839.1 hypothetical protein IE00_00930 [Paracoccus sp. SM22M-07]